MHYGHAFIAVVKELFSLGSAEAVLPLSPQRPSSLPAPRAVPLITATGEIVVPVAPPPSSSVELGTHTEAYVVVAAARLFLRPVLAFDSVLMSLPYATIVRVLRHEGRFSSVQYRESVGWVHKDDIVYSAASIFPEFVPNERYDAHHSATEAVRRYLNDDFYTEALYLPLLREEYVSYVLKRSGRPLVWPATRPRLAGTWHSLLRGVRGVHIGLNPRTGSLIEYDVPEAESVLGYVEVVRPDGTLVVAAVGRSHEGQFSRFELSESAYREAKALFITVT